jgi:predicted DNA-binding transcriptional regulator YafY
VPESAPTHRALRLLELFQARRVWAGSDLAERLGTDGRTLRRDIERLRSLGYSIDTRRGPGGGYSLSTGSDLPPLVFTPDEALAVAAALASSAASGAAGGGELALTALAKIEQVMPAKVRRRVRALRSSVSLAQTPNAAAGAYPTPLDADVLGVLALACRDAEQVRLHHMQTAGPEAGQDAVRRVEPVALVPRGTRWFLVCRDLERGWRALRVDRITRAMPTGTRFAARAVPGGDSVLRRACTRPRSSSTRRSTRCRPT